jgi:LysM repeat protein
MGLEKARLEPIYPQGDSIDVMFNPEEYTVNKDNNFAQMAVPGLSGPLIQFVNGNMQTLEMELFLDTYEAGGDVRDEVNKVANFLKITSETHAPPVLTFTWASLSFTCVLARVSQRFTMFHPDGTPVRARLNVTFNEFIDAEREAKETNRQTADFSKVHVVTQGETLSGIAGRMYENPLVWRPIAIANEIDDPRSITVGQSLVIPSLPFTDPDSGEVIR